MASNITAQRSKGPAKWLNEKGLTMIPEYFGARIQVEAVEKLKLIQYFMANGHLPPGNTKFQ